MTRKSDEVNFDSIVGPTHNYSGLSYGNVASLLNQKNRSNPKQAALQGLAKMKFLMDLGVKQAVLPPQERPNLDILRLLGFTGSDSEIIAKAYKDAPEVLFSCNSASSMWAANAATVSPSPDTDDHFVHFTPANLISKFHRSIETSFTATVLKKIFYDIHHFIHHPPVFSSNALADEGAANHGRLCKEFNQPGVELFVYGRTGLGEQVSTTARYPARQCLEASQTIARLHQLNSDAVVFAKQHPRAIDAGVFHNDVISVAHQNLFFYHEFAFENKDVVINELQNKFTQRCNDQLCLIEVSEARVPLQEAVTTYLFNSQLVTFHDNSIHLIAPIECQESITVKNYLEEIVADPANPIKKVHYINIRESMRNGGGPACLRLRVVLSPKEIGGTHPRIFLNQSLYEQLVNWVERHYRDSLLPEDLADPQLILEGHEALNELTKLLSLGNIYNFQK